MGSIPTLYDLYLIWDQVDKFETLFDTKSILGHFFKKKTCFVPLFEIFLNVRSPKLHGHS